MNKDMMQDKLKQLRDKVKQRWGALTDKDLDTVDVKAGSATGSAAGEIRVHKRTS